MKIRKSFWKSRDGNHLLTAQLLRLLNLSFFILVTRNVTHLSHKEQKRSWEREVKSQFLYFLQVRTNQHWS